MTDRVLTLLQENTIEDGGCLIWQGRLSASRGHPKHGTLVMRRAVWEAKYAPLDKADRITTTCGNPRCLEHLAKTTRSEIAQRVNADPRVKAIKRVKAAEWARANRAKLDMEKVRHIRSSTEDDHTLARQYGVDHSLISKVRTNKAWVDRTASPFAGLGER